MTKNITVRYWVSHTWPYSIDDKPDDPEAKIYTIAIDEREIFIRNGKKYYSLQSGHGQSTDLLIEECLEGIEMITCECGHKLDDHDVGYCNQWELNDCACECSLNWDAVEARYWARRMMKERDDWKHAAESYETCAMVYKANCDWSRDKNRDLRYTLEIIDEALKRLEK
jgi:hypothetical protein